MLPFSMQPSRPNQPHPRKAAISARLRLCGRDAGYRFIVGDAVPDHTVIARFRQRHVARMREVFLAVLRLCHEAGLVRLGLVALDGTKVGASAALDANRTASRIDEQVTKIARQRCAGRIWRFGSRTVWSAARPGPGAQARAGQPAAGDSGYARHGSRGHSPGSDHRAGCRGRQCEAGWGHPT